MERELHEQAGHDVAPLADAPEAVPARLSVALIGGASLGRQIVHQWLRQVSPASSVRCFAAPQDLLDDDGRGSRPDLILCEFLHARPTADSFDALRPLTAAYGDCPIVVLSAAESPALIAEALRRGIRGYITTSLPLAVAAAAVRLVLLGGTFAPPASTQGAPGRLGGSPSDGAALAPPGRDGEPPATAGSLRLSPRERQVLRLLRSGLSNRMIAEELGISQNTVMVHVRHLMRKLGATNRTQAVFRARFLLAQGTDGDG